MTRPFVARSLGLVALSWCWIAPVPCWARPPQETTTYTYDALGRLVTSTTAGGPNGGVTVQPAYDPAGNRTQYNVSGSSNTSPMKFIVVPLAGMTLIPIPVG